MESAIYHTHAHTCTHALTHTHTHTHRVGGGWRRGSMDNQFSPAAVISRSTGSHPERVLFQFSCAHSHFISVIAQSSSVHWGRRLEVVNNCNNPVIISTLIWRLPSNIRALLSASEAGIALSSQIVFAVTRIQKGGFQHVHYSREMWLIVFFINFMYVIKVSFVSVFIDNCRHFIDNCIRQYVSL